MVLFANVGSLREEQLYGVGTESRVYFKKKRICFSHVEFEADC